MKKLSFISAGLLVALVIFMSSCAKNDNLVTGTVYKDNQPVQGADVHLVDPKTDEDVMSTTTDANGQYTFYPVDDGTYYVDAYSGIYSGSSENFTVKGKDNKEINIYLKVLGKKQIKR